MAVGGPAFEVLSLRIDEAAHEARVELDDGTAETIGDDALGMSDDTGRFECRVRGGCFAALLRPRPAPDAAGARSRSGGRFFLRAGSRRIPVRT